MTDSIYEPIAEALEANLRELVTAWRTASRQYLGDRHEHE